MEGSGYGVLCWSAGSERILMSVHIYILLFSLKCCQKSPESSVGCQNHVQVPYLNILMTRVRGKQPKPNSRKPFLSFRHHSQSHHSPSHRSHFQASKDKDPTFRLSKSCQSHQMHIFKVCVDGVEGSGYGILCGSVDSESILVRFCVYNLICNLKCCASPQVWVVNHVQVPFLRF